MPQPGAVVQPRCRNPQICDPSSEIHPCCLPHLAKFIGVIQLSSGEAIARLNIDAVLAAEAKLPPLPPRGACQRILVTCHRRESWGDGLDSIAAALAEFASDAIQIDFVLHPNPWVAARMRALLEVKADDGTWRQLRTVALSSAGRYDKVVADSASRTYRVVVPGPGLAPDAAAVATAIVLDPGR